MPPRTRKKAPVDPNVYVPPIEETPVSEETPRVVDVEVTDAPKRRGGRKPSPLTAVLRDFEKSKARLARAEKRAANVEEVANELAAAQEEFNARRDALNDVYATLTA